MTRFDYVQLQAENARLREAVQMLQAQLPGAEFTLVYSDADGDSVPSATYVQVALVKLLSEEREARRRAESQIRVALAECHRALNEHRAYDLVGAIRQLLRQQSTPEIQ